MTAATTRLPPLQPTYVLRGHPAAVHSLLFLRNNTRLLSGDADGWVVLWSVITKRPIAAWQAQDGTVVGLGAWGSDKLITCASYPFHHQEYMLIIRFEIGMEEKVSSASGLSPKEMRWAYRHGSR